MAKGKRRAARRAQPAKARPARAQAQPARAKARPARAQAQPARAKAQPARAQAQRASRKAAPKQSSGYRPQMMAAQAGGGARQVTPPPMTKKGVKRGAKSGKKGSGHRGGGPGSGVGPDLSGLGANQTKKYNKLYKNQGANAASAYLDKLGQRGIGPGGDVGPTNPNDLEPSVYPDLRPGVRKQIQGQEAVEDVEKTKQIQFGNATYNTAFGGSSVSFDEQGNPVYTETLSPEQQGALDRGQALNKQGQERAGELLSGYQQFGSGTEGYQKFGQQEGPQRFQNQAGQPQQWDQFSQGVPTAPGQFTDPTEVQPRFEAQEFQGGQGAAGLSNQMISQYQGFDPGDPAAERQRVESGVYDRLTANVNRDFDREREELEQRLYNRGIPLDPGDARYQREMGALNEKYQAIKADASGQAVQFGEGAAAQVFGQKAQTHQQGQADLQQMYGIGAGANQQQFGQSLAGQQQRQQEIGQQFGQAASTYGLNLQGQGQQFGQALQGYGASLQGQAQAYGQGLGTQQQQNAEIAQQFGQNLQTQQQQMGEMGQLYQQNMGAHQQGMADMQQLQQQGIGFQGFQGPGFNAPTPYELSNPTEVDLAFRNYQLAKKGQNQQYQLGQAQLGLQGEQLAWARQQQANKPPPAEYDDVTGQRIN